MDNYAITGLLALNATLGTKWGTLALLMAMGFFLVIFPFSLAAFEWEKWAVQQHVEAIAEAAAQDIEAAAAAAAAAEEAAEADRGGKHPVSSSSIDEPPGPRGFGDGGGEGGGGLGSKPRGADGLELSLYPASSTLPSFPPPPPLPPVGMTKDAAEDLTTANGFPHDSRYCWWSNEAYRPARPLLGADVAQSSQHPFQRGTTAAAAAAAAREEQQQQRQQQRRRSQEPLLERLLQQQQQEAQRRAAPDVSPLPVKLPLPPPPSADGAASLQPSSALPHVSPFQAPSCFGWRNEVVGGASTTAAGNSSVHAQAPPAAAPGSASPAAGAAALRPAAMSNMPSTSANQSPRHAQMDRREGSLLTAVLDRLAAAACSGQLSTSMIGSGELQGGRGLLLGGGGGEEFGTTSATSQAIERPRLQDLEFALTHQLSGGTAKQLARISRGYTAAAAAASAAAASPDAAVRRLLLAGPGGPMNCRSPLQITSAAARHGGGMELGMASAPPGSAAAGVGQGGGAGSATPRKAPGASRIGLQPPPSASTGTGWSGPLLGPSLATGGAATTIPTALASLESMDSIGPPSPVLGMPPGGEGETEADAKAAAVDMKAAHLDRPTFSRPDASGKVRVAASAAAAAEPRLLSTSTPMFSFGRRSHRHGLTGGAAIATGDDILGRGSEFPVRRGGAFQRSASEMTPVDRTLLKLASGLALDSARRRGGSPRGDRSPTRLLVDTDPAVLLQLASAVSAPELSDLTATATADKQLVREATKEVLRKHGGVARAFAAFVSGHPQLWHIVSTLARNPMIWTMFIAMTVSVSGLRVFLDPASPRYRPEVGWVAGSLSWINGLVVPISIFSNGAWMYGKPLLAKGEVVKIAVLLLIKVGVLPLMMAGCAVLVQLDGQHVAAMTVLTLSPAAAASFVLAVQYGRGVELVSLTNIVGNIFLTPLLIMWLKILTALNISFHLHDDA
ncbi:hypothetical protein Vafri_22044 [Volvox africanus]|nr:hypothetical protein Vafri_22044 [Volvox africanus]